MSGRWIIKTTKLPLFLKYAKKMSIFYPFHAKEYIFSDKL